MSGWREREREWKFFGGINGLSMQIKFYYSLEMESRGSTWSGSVYNLKVSQCKVCLSCTVFSILVYLNPHSTVSTSLSHASKVIVCFVDESHQVNETLVELRRTLIVDYICGACVQFCHTLAASDSGCSLQVLYLLPYSLRTQGAFGERTTYMVREQWTETSRIAC